MPAPAAKVSAVDEGHLYGWGCFETLKLIKGEARFWEQHWERFRKGAATLRLPFPFDSEETQAQGEALAMYNRVTEGVLRLSLHRKQDGVDFLIQATPPRQPAPEAGARISVQGSPTILPPRLAHIKHNNYLPNLVLLETAREDGFDETIMVNAQNELVEGSISNLFVEREDGIMITPPLWSGCLPGIIRDQLLDFYNPIIREGTVKNSQFETASGVMLTNSLWEVAWVREVVTEERTFHFDQPTIFPAIQKWLGIGEFGVRKLPEW